MTRLQRLLPWAAAFGAACALLRLLVLLRGGRGADLALADAAGQALGQAGCALLLGWPLVCAVRSATRLLAALPLLALAVLNSAAWHFEAVTGHLPSAGALGRLEQARFIWPSLAAEAPLPWLVAELACQGALVAALLRRADPQARASRTAVVVAAAAPVIALALLVGTMRAGAAKTPVVWLARLAFESHAAAPPTAAVRPEDAFELRWLMGHRQASIPDRAHPLCAEAGTPAPGTDRSLIVVVLETVGRCEMELSLDGRPVMPRLRQIAAAGLDFTRAVSAGTISSHATPAIFSGLPALPTQNLLWIEPLPRLAGFPRVLREHGYATVYVHGSDLDFEQQRRYLQGVGFDSFVTVDAVEPGIFGSWGWPDQEAFSRLRGAVEARRRDRHARPYLAALHTVTTHHPWRVPESWPRLFAEDAWSAKEAPCGPGGAAYAEALRYSDHALGEFYDWYLANEAPRGTLLAIVGDHVNYIFNDRLLVLGRSLRHDVPFVVAGLSPAELSALRPRAQRLVAQYDLGATLLGLAGLAPDACDQGLDALMPEPAWPKGRIVYAVGTEGLERLDVWVGDERFEFDRSAGAPRLRGGAGRDEGARRAEHFLSLLLPLSRGLVQANAFAPPVAAP